MPFDAHANFAISAVATAPSPATSGTSLVVTAADGTKFPAAPFNAIIWPTSASPSSSNAEIVRVTAISTDTLTITRAQESSSARTVVVGDQIMAGITAKTLTDAEQAAGWIPDSNTWTVHIPPTQSGMTTVTGAGGTVGHAGLTYTNGDAVIITGLTNTTAIVNGGLYYIVGQTSTTVQLAVTPGGSALTFGGSADTGTVTLTGLAQFTVAVDATAYLTPGTKVSWNDATNTPGYGVVAFSVNNSGTTTVSLLYNSDYTMANHAFTVPRYSYQEDPQGFPGSFTWPITLSGWSSNPTTTAFRWSTVGRKCTLFIRQQTATTSNLASHTGTLPVTAATFTNMVWANNCQSTDNGTIQTGILTISSQGVVVSLAGIIATTTNTASGNSCILRGQVTYEF